jgi:hypothetical protein
MNQHRKEDNCFQMLLVLYIYYELQYCTYNFDGTICFWTTAKEEKVADDRF